LIIPAEQLSDEAVDNLIAEYCLRDRGLNECEAPLEHRAQQVRQALYSGRLVILYSQHYQSAQLIAADELTSG